MTIFVLFNDEKLLTVFMRGPLESWIAFFQMVNPGGETSESIIFPISPPWDCVC